MWDKILILIFLAVGTAAQNGEEAKLIFANRRDLRMIDLATKEHTVLVGGLPNAIGIDVDVPNKRVYWTDVARHEIYSAPIDADSSGERTKVRVVSEGIHTPDGLAVDWIHAKMYWTDTGTDTISVAQLDGTKRRTLIATDLDEPRALALDPTEGFMYWTDWGQSAKIERAGMNGFFREAIVNSDIEWPNGLTLDIIGKRIYWVDAKLHSISSVTTTGADRRQILQDDTLLAHPFSITVFQDTLYYTDWESKSIHSVNKSGGDHKVEVTDLYDPMDITVFHPQKQQPGVNYCGENNGLCSDLCLPAPQINPKSAKYTCLCEDGRELLDDNRKCSGTTRTTPKATPLDGPKVGAIIGGLALLGFLIGIFCFCAVACKKGSKDHMDDKTPENGINMAPVAYSGPTVGGQPGIVYPGAVGGAVDHGDRRVRHVYNPKFQPSKHGGGYPGVQNAAYVDEWVSNAI